MRRISAIENVTLDGVMQSPGRPDEDTRNGFAQGGWASRYMDHVAAEEMGRGQQEASRFGSAMLFGRVTYADFASVWPAQPDHPITAFFANVDKYVVSNSLPDDLPWARSHVLRGDAVEVVRQLKETDGPDLNILGSGVLVRSLQAADLIDGYVLSIHPLVLGEGSQLFDRSNRLSSLKLVRSVPTTTGVIIATYEVERT
jgi:dihydrofolate reductase